MDAVECCCLWSRRMEVDKRWRAALRCYQCGGRFTLGEAAFHQMSGLALVARCPLCGARPVFTGRGGPEQNRIHRIVELADEPEPNEAVRLVLRLKPEWYDRLAAGALPGSEARACLENSLWVDGEYLVRCDAPELLALAEIADASRCPEAIEAMRAAYLAAIRAE
jgi:hypothetical protein